MVSLFEKVLKIQLNVSPVGSSQVVLAVKNLPDNTGDIGTWVRSLGWKDPLGKEMATHSSILAWEIAWTEEPLWLHSMRSQKIRTPLNG